jgi:S-adenosylmethionine:tRNA ribosyltransferase-isomerase
MLKLSDFDYKLPKELIAQYPLKERDACRLLILERRKGKIEHCVFKDIIDHLNKDDLLVLNDTKVLRSRLKGHRPTPLEINCNKTKLRLPKGNPSLTGPTTGKVDVLLLNRKNGSKFNALIKPGRLKLREKIFFNAGKIIGEISAKNEITFNTKDIDSIYNLGVMPLPPYIKRNPEDLDNIYYQTVYAQKEGAVASPTAGLHFTNELIKRIESKGVNIAYITLHVGYPTFKPVKVEDITKHKMAPEYFNLPLDSIKLIEKTRKDKAGVVAVGTTSCRVLETLALGKNSGYTDLFIYPGYKFRMTNCLLTNFHLPRTTLFMLVCAFAGTELIKKAYQEAIEMNYRFYSYGDAMLIL